MSRIDVDLKTNLNAPFRKWIEVLKIDMKKNPQNCLLDFLSESIEELLEITPGLLPIFLLFFLLLLN